MYPGRWWHFVKLCMKRSRGRRVPGFNSTESEWFHVLCHLLPKCSGLKWICFYLLKKEFPSVRLMIWSVSYSSFACPCWFCLFQCSFIACSSAAKPGQRKSHFPTPGCCWFLGLPHAGWFKTHQHALGASTPWWQHLGAFSGPNPTCPLLGFQQCFQMANLCFWLCSASCVKGSQCDSEWMERFWKCCEKRSPSPLLPLVSCRLAVIKWCHLRFMMKRLKWKWNLLEFLDPEQSSWQPFEPITESGNCELGLFLLKMNYQT